MSEHDTEIIYSVIYSNWQLIDLILRNMEEANAQSLCCFVTIHAFHFDFANTNTPINRVRFTFYRYWFQFISKYAKSICTLCESIPLLPSVSLVFLIGQLCWSISNTKQTVRIEQLDCNLTINLMIGMFLLN